MYRNTLVKSCGVIVLLIIIGSVPASADYEDTIEQTFTVREGGSLIVDSAVGEISVKTHARETVDVTILLEIDTRRNSTVEEVLEDLDITVEKHGNDVVIETEYDRGSWTRFMFGRGANLKLRYDVVVPETYHVDLQTSGGKITVDDLDGEARCKTSGGSISLERITGQVTAKTSGGSITLRSAGDDAELHTSGGKITIGDVNGDVRAHTSGGGIVIERSAGTVNATTSGGSITIDEVGGTVNAKSSGGGIKVNITSQPTSDCELTTSGGSITAYLNPDCRLSIDAKTSGGRVSTELPVMIVGELSKNRLIADVNGGGPELYLRTSGGGIKLNEN